MHSSQVGKSRTSILQPGEIEILYCFSLRASVVRNKAFDMLKSVSDLWRDWGAMSIILALWVTGVQRFAVIHYPIVSWTSNSGRILKSKRRTGPSRVGTVVLGWSSCKRQFCLVYSNKAVYWWDLCRQMYGWILALLAIDIFLASRLWRLIERLKHSSPQFSPSNNPKVPVRSLGGSRAQFTICSSFDPSSACLDYAYGLLADDDQFVPPHWLHCLHA